MTAFSIASFVRECARHIRHIEEGLGLRKVNLHLTFSDDGTFSMELKVSDFASAHERMRAQVFFQPLHDFLDSSGSSLQGIFNPIKEGLKNGQDFNGVHIGLDINKYKNDPFQIQLFLPVHAIIGGMQRYHGPRYTMDGLGAFELDVSILMGLKNEALKEFKVDHLDSSFSVHGQAADDARYRAHLIYPFRVSIDNITCISTQ